MISICFIQKSLQYRKYLYFMLFKFAVFKILNSRSLGSLFDSCVFDMCATSSNVTLQDSFRCDDYAQLNDKCNQLSQANNLGLIFNWRTPTNCRKYIKSVILLGFSFEIILILYEFCSLALWCKSDLWNSD